MPHVPPPIPDYETLPTWVPGYVPTAIAYYDGSIGGAEEFFCLYATPVPAQGIPRPSQDRIDTCDSDGPRLVSAGCFWYLGKGDTSLGPRWQAFRLQDIPSYHVVEMPVSPPADPVAVATPGAPISQRSLTGAHLPPTEPCPKGYQKSFGGKCVKISGGHPPKFPSGPGQQTGILTGVPAKLSGPREDLVPRLNDATFLAAVSGEPVLVSFSAPTKCPKCPLQAPALENAAMLHGIPAFHVDVEQADSAGISGSRPLYLGTPKQKDGTRGPPQMMADFRVPAHYVFAHGKPIARLAGLQDLEDVIDLYRHAERVAHLPFGGYGPSIL